MGPGGGECFMLFDDSLIFATLPQDAAHFFIRYLSLFLCPGMHIITGPPAVLPSAHARHLPCTLRRTRAHAHTAAMLLLPLPHRMQLPSAHPFLSCVAATSAQASRG